MKHSTGGKQSVVDLSLLEYSDVWFNTSPGVPLESNFMSEKTVTKYYININDSNKPWSNVNVNIAALKLLLLSICTLLIL